MLHERLRQLRESRKLKQYEVADRVGVVRSTYGGYERGDRIPDAYTLSRLADLYFVSTDYLLCRDTQSEMVPGELLKLAESLKPNEQADFWNDLIKYAKFIHKKD